MKKKIIVTLAILDVLALACLFLAYGPIAKFRKWLVPASIGSWHHHYLARTIYTDKQIRTILNSMSTTSPEGNTDSSQIEFNGEDPLVYSSIYEEQILKRDKDDLIKIIEIEGSTYKGYLLVVYDSKRISLQNSSKIKKGGQQIAALAKEKDAIAAVNASGFVNNRTTGVLTPFGACIIDGKLYTDGTGVMVGFDSNGVLVVATESATEAIQNGMMHGVSFGPALIVNGEAATFEGEGGYGLRPRTAIGQRKDGIVIFAIIDGNPTATRGVDMKELTNIFIRYGAYNAANIDGGGSTSLYANGKLINTPAGTDDYYEKGRFLPNAWIIK